MLMPIFALSFMGEVVMALPSNVILPEVTLYRGIPMIVKAKEDFPEPFGPKNVGFIIFYREVGAVEDSFAFHRCLQAPYFKRDGASDFSLVHAFTRNEF